MRLWRSLGFPEAADDAVLFNDRDLDAAKLMASLTDAGLLDPDVREAVTRATAQSMSRLAEWQVGMLDRLIESSGAHRTLSRRCRWPGRCCRCWKSCRATCGGGTWPPRSSGCWSPKAADGRECLVVGVADMIGFTPARRRSTAELAEMIERFGSSTTEVIAEGRGRIVKTIGDEVLFVAHTSATARRSRSPCRTGCAPSPRCRRCASAWPRGRSSCATGTCTARS